MMTGCESKCNDMLSGAGVDNVSAGTAADNTSAGAAVGDVSAANNDNDNDISSRPSNQSVYIEYLCHVNEIMRRKKKQKKH